MRASIVCAGLAIAAGGSVAPISAAAQSARPAATAQIVHVAALTDEQIGLPVPDADIRSGLLGTTVHAGSQATPGRSKAIASETRPPRRGDIQRVD